MAGSASKRGEERGGEAAKRRSKKALQGHVARLPFTSCFPDVLLRCHFIVCGCGERNEKREVLVKHVVAGRHAFDGVCCLLLAVFVGAGNENKKYHEKEQEHANDMHSYSSHASYVSRGALKTLPCEQEALHASKWARKR